MVVEVGRDVGDDRAADPDRDLIGIELLAREMGRHGHDPFAWGCSGCCRPLAISAEAGAALP